MDARLDKQADQTDESLEPATGPAWAPGIQVPESPEPYLSHEFLANWFYERMRRGHYPNNPKVEVHSLYDVSGTPWGIRLDWPDGETYNMTDENILNYYKYIQRSKNCTTVPKHPR